MARRRAPERRCAECGSPLAADQRYCLTCGARAGERDPRVAAMMGRARDIWRPEPVSESTARDPAARRGRRVLPSWRMSAGLLTAFLGFGVALGAAAASSRQDALSASSAAPLKLILPRTGTATGPSTPSASAEPPPASEEATPPEAAVTTPSTAAKAPAPSSESGGSERSAEGSGESPPSTAPAKKLPPVKHVFLLVLSDVAYATAFGPASASHYLSSTLERQGELLGRYDAISHEELANEVALISGQGPNPQTAANCPQYVPLSPGTVAADEQATGAGCVYPASTQTLPAQLTAKHLTWRAYVEGMDEPGPAPGPCSHPQPGQADPTASQTASTGPYATFRNPFVYFAGLTGSQACARGDVGIGPLHGDLAKASSTPNLVYVVPDRCHDGNPTPCTAGAPAGMAAADRFLQRVVPEILASPAYHESGLLVITADEAPSTGEFADSSSCCAQPSYPNLPAPSSGPARHGGGAVGALLLSPYVKGATTSQEPFNHFSLLRTIEDLFSLRHLGYAALPGVPSLPPALFLAKAAGH